jgi:hypothetical protein
MSENGIPEFWKLEIRYKCNDKVPKYDKDGKEVIWKVDGAFTNMGPVFIFHPDFRESFIKKCNEALVRAIEIAPILKPEE